MDQTHDSELHPHPAFEKQKVSFWRKLGGGSLTISLVIHGIILAIGVYLVVQVIPKAAEPPIDILSKSGGGGTPAAPPSAQKATVNTTQSNASRIAAKGVSSAFTLPEPDASSKMNALSSLDSGSLSGGGASTGNGPGVGGVTGIGISDGPDNANPFGSSDPKEAALTGVLYDLKQSRSQKPTDMNVGKLRGVLREFVEKGWKERFLNDYFQAPQKLQQTRIFIPNMDANKAPEAFNCADVVQPKMWAVLYKGTVIAPKTGQFRFVGSADDLMCVRFNNKNVMDWGFMTLTGNYRNDPKYRATPLDPATKREAKDIPLSLPLILRPYATTGHYNGAGGLGAGQIFEVTAGSAYPIEILISEVPGGIFGAVLMIEEIGATYSKDKNGSDILPIFRTSGDLPDTQGSNIPPFDKNSPIWKIVSGGGISDI